MLTAPDSRMPDLSLEYCQLDADYGLKCKPTNETAWFYNRTSGACETFVFGGCLGNQNRFLSQSICNSVCVLHGPPASLPRDLFTSVRPPVTSRSRQTPPPTQPRTCPDVDCTGKDCRSGFATDPLGCTLCICADPCEVSIFL